MSPCVRLASYGGSGFALLDPLVACTVWDVWLPAIDFWAVSRCQRWPGSVCCALHERQMAAHQPAFCTATHQPTTHRLPVRGHCVWLPRWNREEKNIIVKTHLKSASRDIGIGIHVHACAKYFFFHNPFLPAQGRNILESVPCEDSGRHIIKLLSVVTVSHFR